jgi:AraC-like DNA-binding protein
MEQDVISSMPSIPLPFVIAMFLCVVLARAVRQSERRSGLFPLLIAAFAVQAVLSGLNWNVGWYPARLIQPVLAAALPALAFCAFDQLRQHSDRKLVALLPHFGPALVVAILIAVWRSPVDVVLFAVYLGYGSALLGIARQGPDALSAARISDGWTAYKALVAIAIMLIATSVLDAVISLEFAFGHIGQGRNLLSIASVLWLALAGYACTIADGTRPEIEENTGTASSSVRTTDSADDFAIADTIDTIMREKHLYRDPDLTLERLARRVGIPGRQISGAVNRIHGRNVSQFVNEYRVNAVRRQLITTRDPVTTIMLESGFGTKSNFNREFLRVTGMTPSEYRRNGGVEPATSNVSAQASSR